MGADDFDDYWVQSPKGEPTPMEPALQMGTIDDVKPLDEQFGAAVLKTVPDALYEPLFGQPDDTPLHTYAILDAAKVPNLPELLEVSGLAHRCLFKGDAYDELKDVAPWIVQLEDGNAFTRNLFTQTDAPWHLWDNEPGIYVRSRDELGDVRAHWRKFTRVQDEAGAWFYLRLYDPYIIQAFLHGAPDFADRILSRPFPWDDLTVVTCFSGQVKTFRAAQKTLKERGVIRLGSDEKAVLRHLTFEARADGLMNKLDKSSVIAMPTEPDVRAAHKKSIVTALHRMHGYGFQQPTQQDRWATWEIFYGEGFEQEDPALLRHCTTTDTSSGERFALFQKRLEEVYS